jgi:N-acetylglucosamine malate deacetylase 1
MHVDVLCFGAHPDDVECGAAGLALLFKSEGLSLGIVDLTRGEMGSRGTPEERAVEAQASADLLGARFRENLDLGDCRVADTEETRKLIAARIRQHTPQVVLAPHWDDLHNDHVATGMAVRRSLLFCALAKLPCAWPPHKPKAFLYYLLNSEHQPSVIGDITSVWEGKVEAVKLFRSQFARTAAESGTTPLGSGDYLFHLESRSRFYGSLIGVRYGEALISERPLKMTSLRDLFGLKA